MHRYAVSKIFLASLGALLFAALGVWFFYDPADSLSLLVPGMDGAPEDDSLSSPGVIIGEFFLKGEGAPSQSEYVWAGFRGPRWDNIVNSPPSLPSSWRPDGPKVIWSVELGEGHAAPVVAHGSVYILDYDEETETDALRRLSLLDGREIWRRFYRVPLKRNHGFSRTAPAVEGNYLVSMGPMCHVMAVNALTGELLWTLDVAEKYGSEIPLWYSGQNPLLHNGVAVIATGGAALMIGIDAASGKTLWEAPNPGNWPMSHSSVIPAVIDGTPMYLYAATEGAAGVSLNGDILWLYDGWKTPVTVPSPIPLPEGRIFLTAGYGSGSAMIQVKNDTRGFTAEKLFSFPSGGGLSSEQQTPLFVDGMLIGITPKDAKNLRSRLAASDLDGNILWTALAEERLGLGPYLYADGKLYILKDDGTLFMGEVKKDGFTLLDKRKILDGTDAWAPMALAGDTLLLRDSRRLICLNLK